MLMQELRSYLYMAKIERMRVSFDLFDLPGICVVVSYSYTGKDGMEHTPKFPLLKFSIENENIRVHINSMSLYDR